MALIEARNLTKTFVSGNVATPVLHGLALTIDRGEFVAIMGPSGSGKSTLMHILGFLDTPTSGSYFFDGQDAGGLTDLELARMRNKRVGFVFQAFHLLPRTTVTDNVELPLLYAATTEIGNNSQKAIQAVGLAHRANYLPNQLSGGEKQRVAIARALVNNPDVIFADEPTGNLDSKSGAQILAIMQSLNTAGHTIIMVTHERDTVAHAKRIILMRDGNIISDAPNTEWRDANGRELVK